MIYNEEIKNKFTEYCHDMLTIIDSLPFESYNYAKPDLLIVFKGGILYQTEKQFNYINDYVISRAKDYGVIEVLETFENWLKRKYDI